MLMAPGSIKKIVKASQKVLKKAIKAINALPTDLYTEFDPVWPNTVDGTVYKDYCITAPTESSYMENKRAPLMRKDESKESSDTQQDSATTTATESPCSLLNADDGMYTWAGLYSSNHQAAILNHRLAYRNLAIEAVAGTTAYVFSKLKDRCSVLPSKVSMSSESFHVAKAPSSDLKINDNYFSDDKDVFHPMGSAASSAKSDINPLANQVIGTVDGVGVAALDAKLVDMKMSGTITDKESKCKDRIDKWASRIEMGFSMQDWAARAMTERQAWNIPGGGSATRNLFARAWCDTFCVNDTLTKNDNAIQLSLQKSMQQTEQNMVTLAKWNQKGTTIMGALLYEQSDFFFAAEMTLLKALVKNSQEQYTSFVDVHGGINDMASELQSLVQRGFSTASGETMAARALQRFDTEVGGLTFGEEPNATAAMALFKAYRDLHSNLQHAGGSGQQRRHQHRAASLLEQANSASQELLVQGRSLGLYRARLSHLDRERGLLRSSIKEGWTAVQTELADAIATSLLLELDKIYWQIREAVDEYVSSEEEQHWAYTESISAIQNYVKCQSVFASLHDSYRAAIAARNKARHTLQTVWRKIEMLAGQMTSVILDGDIPRHFARLDAQAVNASSVQRILEALPGEKPSCLLEHKLARPSLQQLIMSAQLTGVFGQTLTQAEIVFEILSSMRDRFMIIGVAQPGNDVVRQSAESLAEAFRAASAAETSIGDGIVDAMRGHLPGCHQVRASAALLQEEAGLKQAAELEVAKIKEHARQDAADIKAAAEKEALEFREKARADAEQEASKIRLDIEAAAEHDASELRERALAAASEIEAKAIEHAFHSRAHCFGSRLLETLAPLLFLSALTQTY
jgi:hypothetical protein